MKDVYSIKMGLEELYKRFLNNFSKLGWNVERKDGVLIAEGPRRIHWYIIIPLFVVGSYFIYHSLIEIPLRIIENLIHETTFLWRQKQTSLLILQLIIGVLFWIISLIHILIADRHKIIIVKELDSYNVITNSNKAHELVTRWLKEVGAVRVVKMSVEEMYRSLLTKYERAWGKSGKSMLEKRISDLMRERNMSREQAITTIYNEEAE